MDGGHFAKINDPQNISPHIMMLDTGGFIYHPIQQTKISIKMLEYDLMYCLRGLSLQASALW